MEAITFAGVLGAIVGSFLNVVAYRLPRHESLVSPASHCPSCGTPVKPYDNIPILSWLLLRGRCRSCSARRSRRATRSSRRSPRRCASARCSRNDTAPAIALERRPDPARRSRRADRPRAPHHPQPADRARRGARARRSARRSIPRGEPERLIAGAAAGGFLLLAALAYPGGMGMGDVKLAGVMGLFLGAAVAPAILIALLAGVLVGAVVIARKGAQRRAQDGGPVRPVPRARRARRRVRRAARCRPLHDHFLLSCDPKAASRLPRR